MGRIVDGLVDGVDRIKTISFDRDVVRIIDQVRLPLEECELEISDYISMGEAIKRLSIRGAPAIGVACAFGVYLGLKGSVAGSYRSFREEADKVISYLRSTRPTAVNLFWALDRMDKFIGLSEGLGIGEIKEGLYREAVSIFEDDLDRSLRIGINGECLLRDNSSVITHCNAGGLATSGYGTALSVIFRAVSLGKSIHVYVDETRPLLQGSRLTAWELSKQGIGHTLITDSTACYAMKTKGIDACIVGADRIALNGDVANKVGTYGLAVSAKAHGIPFYVAAPLSTFDSVILSGDDIPIEERSSDELTRIGGVSIAPAGVSVYSPAFDVTPCEYITAIITESGIIEFPFLDKIGNLLGDRAL